MIRLLALLGATTISFSAVFVRLADTSPSTAAFFRAAYALPVLALVALLSGVIRWGNFRLRASVFFAGCLMGLAFTVWNYAIAYIGAGLSTVLGNTQVVFVGLLAWLMWGERPRLPAFAAVPMVFAGVVLVSGLGRPDAYGQAPVPGTVMAMINALLYTAFLLIFRAVTRHERSPVGPLLDATAGAAVVAFAAGLLTDPAFTLAFAWPTHGWLAALALGSQVVGWLLIMTALPRLPALETSVILLLQPMLTVVWGLLIFRELLSPLQWTGVFLVLTGIAVMNLPRRSAVGSSAHLDGLRSR